MPAFVVGLVMMCLLGTSLAVAASGGAGGSRVPTSVRLGDAGGTVLELRLGGRGEVIAWRTGRRVRDVAAETGRMSWQLPDGDAVLLEGGWWTPVGSPVVAGRRRPGGPLMRSIRGRIAPTDDGLGRDRLYDAALGDVTGDGRGDLVVAYRRPFRRTLINVTRPADEWRDEAGMSAHLGVYDPRSLRETWVAGTLVLPVVRVAVCDGSLAVAYGSLRTRGVQATGAWRWQGFGFLPSEPLPGRGRPVCVDMDGDGRREPAVLGREAS